MTAERDDKLRPDRQAPRAPDASFDEVLREVVAPDEETSSEDTDAGAVLERFPAAALEPQRPKKD